MAVGSLRDYLEAVGNVLSRWDGDLLRSVSRPDGSPFPKGRDDYHELAQVAWFRGQASNWPLIPRIYQQCTYSRLREATMNLTCRATATALPGTPRLEDYPAWLCLMQHHGLPTRLLDWTESSAAALYFAVEQHDQFVSTGQFETQFKPVVWMANPHALNWVSAGGSVVPRATELEASGNPRDGYTQGWGLASFRAAFDMYAPDPDLPMAVIPLYSHERMQVQRSRFTVHGARRDGVDGLFRNTDLHRTGLLYAIEIDKAAAISILKDLLRLGVSRASLFPDLEGVARELGFRFAHP